MRAKPFGLAGMSDFLNHSDNFIHHLIMHDDFGLNARDKFGHVRDAFIFCVLRSAFSKALDFHHGHPGQAFNAVQFLCSFQQLAWSYDCFDFFHVVSFSYLGYRYISASTFLRSNHP